jgi:hypothetical protein
VLDSETLDVPQVAGDLEGLLGASADELLGHSVAESCGV